MVIVNVKPDKSVEEIPFKRTESNERARPDSSKRHQDEIVSSKDDNELNLFNSKDLEWLAWNWRAWYNQKNFKTRRSMAFGHINQDLCFLPCLQTILYGVILGQINVFMDQFSEVKNFNFVIDRHLRMWKHIFAMQGTTDGNKQLTPAILSNSKHDLVKKMLYVYSMESFIFSEMNKTIREKDTSKIEIYGPLAAALSFIVHAGNKKLTDLSQNFTVYRGLKMQYKELKERYKVGNVVNLVGFTSTTLDR